MRKTLMLFIVMMIWLGTMSAAETSPGWTYGFDLGLARGDNAGSRENFAPYGRGYLQLEIFKFLQMRTGVGFVPLRAHEEYSTSTLIGDYRVIFSPYYNKKYAPFIFGGVGASLDMSKKGADVVPQFPMGIGTKINYKRGKDIEITAGYSLTNSDKLDNIPGSQEHGSSLFAGDNRDGYFFLTAGLSFSNPGPEPRREEPVLPPPPPPVIQKPIVEEKPVVIEKEKPVDLRTLDSDKDGLSDYDEINIYKTDPYKADTDGDGLSDYDEVMKYKTNPLLVDTDGDGLSDYDELMKYKTDPLLADTDKGGKNDGEEIAEGKDPLNPKDDVMDLTVGASFSLEGILFETAKSNILPESLPILEQAYTALAANPEVKILIVGHTDSVGSAASNLTLSKSRAASVRQWLVDRGIAPDRIRTDGKGLTQPRATNDTAEGRALNRRIEFIVE